MKVEELQRFVGGEIEIQNKVEGYLYRGLISKISYKDTDIAFGFIWQAKNRGGPIGSDVGLSLDWDVVEPNRDYVISPEIYTDSNLENGRMALNSSFANEMAVLFPPDGSAMNPERIHGLEPTIASEQRRRHEHWEASR